jgi:glycine oxidase
MGRLGASHVFVATGHHRNGVLLAPETASLMTALMLDDDVPVWAKVFAPGRQERIRPV